MKSPAENVSIYFFVFLVVLCLQVPQQAQYKLKPRTYSFFPLHHHTIVHMLLRRKLFQLITVNLCRLDFRAVQFDLLKDEYKVIFSGVRPYDPMNDGVT